MSFSPQTFLSGISARGGPAKANRFEVFIPLPPAVLNFGSYASEVLRLQCEASSIPGKVLQTADVKIYGPTFKVPYQTQFADLDLTFICSNSFVERKIFDSWINAIMPFATNNLRFPKDNNTRYLTNIQIIQYDEAGNDTHIVECLDSFPVGIASQPLNWSDDNLHRLTVSFSYQKIRNLK